MDTLFEVAVIDIHPLFEDWNKVEKYQQTCDLCKSAKINLIYTKFTRFSKSRVKIATRM